MDKLAPHPTLERYYAAPETRQREVDSMFDRAAAHYDRTTQLMSLGSGSWYRKDALRRHGVGRACVVLDTGAGTGALTLPAQDLVGADGSVLALDPSENMLATGVHRGIRIPVRGLGEALPFANDRFDFVTMGYALRHVPDLVGAFSEYRRVLKPGGKVLLLEISRPDNAIGRGVLKGYMRFVVPLLAQALSGGADSRRLMEYYWDTIESCVPAADVLDALSSAGFVDPQRRTTMGCFSEYTAENSGAVSPS